MYDKNYRKMSEVKKIFLRQFFQTNLKLTYKRWKDLQYVLIWGVRRNKGKGKGVGFGTKNGRKKGDDEEGGRRGMMKMEEERG